MHHMSFLLPLLSLLLLRAPDILWITFTMPAHVLLDRAGSVRRTETASAEEEAGPVCCAAL